MHKTMVAKQLLLIGSHLKKRSLNCFSGLMHTVENTQTILIFWKQSRCRPRLIKTAFVLLSGLFDLRPEVIRASLLVTINMSRCQQAQLENNQCVRNIPQRFHPFGTNWVCITNDFKIMILLMIPQPAAQNKNPRMTFYHLVYMQHFNNA